ncbi:MAG: tubulin-like doman-containing protein [Pseudomonadota bacterium]
MRTSFIIGLGGTGDWVLTFLKAKIEASHGSVPANVRLRLLDTIARDLREKAFESEDRSYQLKGILGDKKEKVAQVGRARMAGGEYFSLVPSGADNFYQRAEEIKAGSHPHLNWFRAEYYLSVVPRANFSLSDGAGQWRQFGRMGVYFYSASLGSDLPTMVNNCLTDLSGQRGQAGDAMIDVFLVGSLAGGTGAGTFLDAGNLVREVANAYRHPIRLVAMLILPGAFTRVPNAAVDPARAYAAFLELHRLQSSFGSDNPFCIAYGSSFVSRRPEKLFDGVYLLDAKRASNSLEQALPERGLFPSVADGLELFLDENSGSKLVQDSCNVTAQHVRDVKDAFVPAIYSTFGTWKIILPARLYSQKFAQQLVKSYLEDLVPREKDPNGAWRLVDDMRGGERRPVEHRKEALALLSQSHAFFGHFLNRLPDQPEYASLEGFAEGLSSQRILSTYLTVQDPNANRTLEVEAPKLARAVLDGVKNGEETGMESEKAIAYLKDQCRLRREEYFKPAGEFEAALGQVLRLVAGEINAALDQKLTALLKADTPEARRGQLGYLQQLLAHLEALLHTLNSAVLEAIRALVSDKRGSVQKLELAARDRQSDMDATKGMDGGLFKAKSKKSWAAQSIYLQAVERWVAREQQELLLAALQDLNRMVAANISRWGQVVGDWANRLALGMGQKEPSTLAACDNRIAAIDAELLRMAQSYTASLGLSVWQPGSKETVDTTMGGYEQELYARHQAGLELKWLASSEWVVKLPQEAGDALQLRLRVALDDGQAPQEMDVAAADQALRERAFAWFMAAMDQESVLDYLAQKSDADKVAQLLADKASPMLSINKQHGGDQTSASLVYQAQAQQAAFMGQVAKAIEAKGSFGSAINQQEMYADPHTLVFAVMVDRLVEDAVETLAASADSYWQEMAGKQVAAMQQLQYHVFRSEQQAALIAKDYFETQVGGYKGLRWLSPVVVQVLDHPDYVRAFVRAWSHGLIFSGFSNGANANLWCLSAQAPPEEGLSVDQIFTKQAPGLVLARQEHLAGHTREVGLLDALTGFALRRHCLERPVNAVDLNRVERLIGDLRARRRQAAGNDQDFFQAMLTHYEQWVAKADPLSTDDKLNEFWQKLQPLGSDWERTSLRIVVRYYLNLAAEAWRKRM